MIPCEHKACHPSRHLHATPRGACCTFRWSMTWIAQRASSTGSAAAAGAATGAALMSPPPSLAGALPLEPFSRLFYMLLDVWFTLERDTCAAELTAFGHWCLVGGGQPRSGQPRSQTNVTRNALLRKDMPPPPALSPWLQCIALRSALRYAMHCATSNMLSCHLSCKLVSCSP